MPTDATHSVGQLLALVRLGDVDHRGWWRSRSVDHVAEYVLGDAFPSTWMATGLELAMESARIRHDTLLDRRTAVHLFSDYLPFHRMLRSWLIERKLERDLEPLTWTRDADTNDLARRIGGVVKGERRANGLYLGQVTLAQLEDDGYQEQLLQQLGGAYLGLGDEFVAPYVDLAT